VSPQRGLSANPAGPASEGSIAPRAPHACARRRRPRLLVVLAAAVALLAAACGNDDDSSGASSDDLTVRPFDEVQASEITFEADPSDPTRGIFRVTTTEPMICAIVWGTDGSYGRFNNSLSMNGTGIEQHDVVLPDIEPGIEYHYVVQGTTAGGRLYRSDPATFGSDDGPTTTAEAADPGDNLALDAEIVDISSEFSDAFAAGRAVDGDTGTEWATSGDGDDGSITLDLGSTQQITGVEFLTRSMADGTSITDTYTVTVDDGETFGPFPAGTVAEPRVSELDTTGRRLRFEVETSTGGNVGAVEIRVYGPAR
jgi:hypothetical protein